MQLPQVTVILCNYNYNHYIEDAIDSVFNQNYKKIGLMVIDDASTDDSWNTICRKCFPDEYQIVEHEDFYGRITRTPQGMTIYAIRLKNNGGPSRARNFGIEHTMEGTDYYQILDADDIMHPNKVNTLVENVLGLEDVGVAYADYDILDVENDVVITEYKEPFSKERLIQECIVHSGALIKKQALIDCRDQFGFYDQEMRTCEDYDLWVRISEKYMIFHVPEVLTLVRNQPNNSTKTVHNEVWQRNWQRISLKLQARQNV